MLEIILLAGVVLSVSTSVIFFILWLGAAKKYSLAETEKLVKKYRSEFDNIVSERLEITQQKAIEITERFNSVESEIEYFNEKMRDAQMLISKLNNTDALINNTVEKNTKRDEAIIVMNKEIEQIKSTSSNFNLNTIALELTNGLEEALKRLKSCERKNEKLKKEFDGFENVILDIVNRIKVLENK